MTISKSMKTAKPQDLYVDKSGRAYLIVAVFNGPTAILQSLMPLQGESPQQIGTLDDPQFASLERAYRPVPPKKPKPLKASLKGLKQP